MRDSATDPSTKSRDITGNQIIPKVSENAVWLNNKCFWTKIFKCNDGELIDRQINCFVTLEQKFRKQTTFEQIFCLLRVYNPNNDDFVGKYSSGDLLILKDFYRRNREISILCFVGTYIINVLDASVDSHLFDYDISEDISLQIKPTSTANLNGLSLTLNL